MIRLKQLLNEKTLYHGTVVDFIPSIKKLGLIPSVGEFVRTAYAGATDGDIDEYLKELVFATDKQQLSKAVNAITAQVGAKLHKDFHSVTDDEFQKYGALAIVKDGDSVMSHRDKDDENYYGNYPYTVEPGDYYSEDSVGVDYILTGTKLISFLKRFGEWPRNFGPTAGVKKGEREELIRMALKLHPAVDKSKVLQAINVLTPQQLTQYHAQYKQRISEVIDKIPKSWLHDPNIWLGVIDHQGSIHVVKLGDSVHKATTHNDYFPKRGIQGQRFRWRDDSNAIFWWEEPTEEEKMKVTDWMYKKFGFEPIHSTHADLLRIPKDRGHLQGAVHSNYGYKMPSFYKREVDEIKKSNIGWFSVDPRPITKVKELVNSILKDISELIRELGFGQIKVNYVVHNREALATFSGIIDSTVQPVITMSTRILYQWAKKYGYKLDREVERVIVHELGHAYLELQGMDVMQQTKKKNVNQVEEIVERFAQFYTEHRNISEAKQMLDDFLEDYSFHSGNVIGESTICKRCNGWKHVYVRAGIPNIVTKCPVCVDKPKNIKVYRGVSAYNRSGNNWYTTDKEWARQFTQSGQDKEIIQKTINTSVIMKRENVPLPQATNPDDIDQAITDAKFGKFDAFWVDEGQNQPLSIYVINSNVLK